jgi:hypothetical protein
MYAPPLFADRSQSAQILIGAIAPAALGGLAGVLVGVSVAAYWSVSLVAAGGAFMSGFDHRDGWEAADHGFLAGVSFGAVLVLVHYLVGTPAKVSLGSFPPLLVIVTAIAGALLAGAGGRAARARRERAAGTPASNEPR